MKKNGGQAKNGVGYHKQAQKDFGLSEIKYKALFDNMSSGVAIYQARNDGEDFVFVDFNRAAERIDKINKEDLIGKSVLEVFPGVKDFGLFEVFRRVWKTGKAEHYPVSQYKDKRIVGWRENYVCKLPSGEIVAIYDDITKHKQSEMALKMSEQCFHAIADYSCFWEIWVNPAGQPIWTNPAVQQITGYSIKEIMAMQDYPMPLVHEKDQARVGRAFRSAMKGGRGKEFEFRFRKKDGTVIWVEMSWQPIYDEKGISMGHRSSIRDITDRKEAEDELRRAKDDWKNIFESISDAVFILDRDHHILDANRKAVVVLQQPKDKIVGRFCYELFHCTDHPPTGCPHEKLLISGHPETADMEVEMLNGIYLVTTAPIFDEEGKIVKTLHIARDITDSKRAEEEITALAKFPDENPNPVLRISGDGTVLYHNKAASTLLDISQCQDANLILKYLNKYVPKVLNLAEPLQSEMECCSKVYSLTFAPVMDFNYVNVYGLDITGRKRAEEEIEKIFNTTNYMICIADMDGYFRRVNSSFEQILGYSSEELLKKPFSEFIHPDDREKTKAVIEEKLSGGVQVIGFENRYRCKDGSYKWLSWTSTPVIKEGLMYAIAYDVTKRKEAEHARYRLNKELEATNKELESILYAASHDLKSPLVNIQGFGHELSQSCDLIRSALADMDKTPEMEKAVHIALNKDIPNALDFILASTTKMDSLLSGLLDLCRLSTSTTNVKLIDMNAIMSNVAASMKYQIKECAAKVDTEPLPPCVGDSSQINCVFSNLLTNALKFLDESRPGRIRIYGRSQDNQSIYCVEDNGIGIAPEHQEKIFEIFYQLEPEKRKGDGLGLAIVRRIIDRYNGRTWVESEAGKGSKFFVSLPNV